MNDIFAEAFAYPGGALLRSRISRGPSHAYILTVSPASHLPAALAASAVCSAPEGEPCGICRHCRKAYEGIHPDIRTLSPDKGRKALAVEQIRDLKRDAAVLPNEAERKVYILPADQLNDSCQNALLKLLEEPPAGSVFLLLTQNPWQLLPTVRSRCVTVHAEEDRALSSDTPAGKLAEVLVSGPASELAVFLCQNAEKLPGQELSQLLTEARRITVRRLGAERDSLRSSRLMAGAQALGETEPMLASNVSAGHICGFLLAKGIEMRKTN